VISARRLISSPEILRIPVSVIPPGVWNFVKFKRGVVTIVLEHIQKKKYDEILLNLHFLHKTLTKIYFN
jgi:hypothetical protein